MCVRASLYPEERLYSGEVIRLRSVQNISVVILIR